MCVVAGVQVVEVSRIKLYVRSGFPSSCSSSNIREHSLEIYETLVLAIMSLKIFRLFSLFDPLIYSKSSHSIKFTMELDIDSKHFAVCEAMISFVAITRVIEALSWC